MGKPIIVASFDVDCQKGFTPLCPNELPVPGGHEIAEALNGNFEYAQYRIGSKDLHPANALWHASEAHPVLSKYKQDSSADERRLVSPEELFSGRNIDVYWPVHCISGTAGAELIDGLPDPIQYDYFVYKGCESNCHPYGACYRDLNENKSTGVIEWLKSKEVTEVLVGGLATDYCVRATALQLAKAGFTVVINLDSCRGVQLETSMAVLSELKEARKLGLNIYAVTDILDYRYQAYWNNPDYEPKIHQ